MSQKFIKPYWLINSKSFYPIKSINSQPCEKLYLEAGEKKLYTMGENGRHKKVEWYPAPVNLDMADGRVLKYTTLVLPIKLKDDIICISEKDWRECTIDWHELDTGVHISVNQLPEITPP
jgi:hypothetical protein